LYPFQKISNNGIALAQRLLDLDVYNVLLRGSYLCGRLSSRVGRS
jgi:hypothetical protein